MGVWLYIVILLTLIVLCMFLDPRPKIKKKENKRDADK